MKKINFNTDESGYFDNGNNYFINGGLQNEKMNTMLSLFQHEYTHFVIFHTSSLGLLIVMSEKIAQLDSSKNWLFHKISRYYKRMQEEIATYSEMLSYYKINGKEEFIKFREDIRINNPDYYRYYRKMCNRNSLLSENSFLSYNSEKIDDLIETLYQIGRDSFNVNIKELKFGSIHNEKELQTIMSSSRLKFNPNCRFGQIIKSLNRDGKIFKYNIPNYIPVTPIEKFEISDYINIVQSVFPNNKNVKDRLSGFSLNSSFKPYGYPDLSQSFPFTDVGGEKHNYKMPRIEMNPEVLLNIPEIVYVDLIFNKTLDKLFSNITITQKNGKQTMTYFEIGDKSAAIYYVLELLSKHNAILRLLDYSIFEFSNWTDILEVFPNRSYLCLSTNVASSIDKIVENLTGAQFDIVKMEGYSILIIQSGNLSLVQPIVTQYTATLSIALEILGLEKSSFIKDQEECKKAGIFIMDGVNVRRNINIDDLIDQFIQFFQDL